MVRYLLQRKYKEEPIHDTWARLKKLSKKTLIMTLIYGPLLNSFIIVSIILTKWNLTMRFMETLGN